jgi:hypothetical protein
MARANAGGAVMGVIGMPRAGGGSKLNLTVIGGLEQPENPKENTIWIKAESIGDVYLQSIKPETANEGDVWVNTGSKYSTSGAMASQQQLQISDNPVLYIAATSIWLYTDGEWAIAYAKVYVSGEWRETVVYIYDYGTFGVNKLATASYWKYLYNAGRGYWDYRTPSSYITIGTNRINIINEAYEWYALSPEIDMTQFTTIKIIGQKSQSDITDKSSSARAYVGCGRAVTYSSGYIFSGRTLSSGISTNEIMTAYADISTVEGLSSIIIGENNLSYTGGNYTYIYYIAMY